MPPKPKPRGLLSSQRAPPPSSLPPFPTDADALTLRDLFSLLLQSEQKLTTKATVGEDQEEEARALLRGVLHGCEWLEGRLIEREGEGTLEKEKDKEKNEKDKEKNEKDKEKNEKDKEKNEKDKEKNEQDSEKAQKANQEEETDPVPEVAPHLPLPPSLHALGLTPLGPLQLLYLQSSSLLSLGVLLPSAPSSAVLAGGKKRRKLDKLAEPRERREWFERAAKGFGEALGLVWEREGEGEKEKDGREGEKEKEKEGEKEGEKERMMEDLVRMGWTRALVLLLKEGENKNEKEEEGEGWEKIGELLRGIRIPKPRVVVGGGTEAKAIADEDEEEEDESGSPSLSTLRSLAHTELRRALRAVVLLCDSPTSSHSNSNSATAAVRIALLDSVIALLAPPANRDGEEDVDVDADADVEASMTRADAALAKFVLVEEEVEEKYRPEDEDLEEEYGEGETQVISLPEEEEDVKEAKRAGELAIELLRGTIDALRKEEGQGKSKGSVAVAVLEGQFKKLEEALLTYSALINESDEQGTEKVRRELMQCREDGGLPQEMEEE